MKISLEGRNKKITINKIASKMGLEKGDELEVKNIEKLNKNSKQFTIIVKDRLKWWIRKWKVMLN